VRKASELSGSIQLCIWRPSWLQANCIKVHWGPCSRKATRRSSPKSRCRAMIFGWGPGRRSRLERTGGTLPQN
jgi:hypothetical protein